MAIQTSPDLQVRVARARGVLALVLAIFVASGLAQESNLDVPAADVQGVVESGVEQTARPPLQVPSSSTVLGSLVSSDTRLDALVRIAALARFLQHAERGDSPDHSLQDDVAWLQRLQVRYGAIEPRSPVLDPAAWLIHLELSGRDLEIVPLTAPSGASLDAYLDQVFDRSRERPAAALLPELLWRVEPTALQTWRQFETWLAQAEGRLDVAATAVPEYLALWAVTPEDEAESPADEVTGPALDESLQRVTRSVLAEDPPDGLAVRSVRAQILAALANAESNPADGQVSLLRLVTLLDGLHEDRYFEFARGLLPIALEIVESPSGSEASPVKAWMQQHLPQLSETYARRFSAIDPRINSTVAAVYDVVSKVGYDTPDPELHQSLRQELADAVAQLALLIPDLGYYFSLAVRDTIAGGMDACTGLMARQDEEGVSSMSRELFDDCQQTLVDLADSEARAAALAGDPDGPFGVEQLRRELSVTAGQRINYGIGYLHERYRTGCPKPSRPLPNPLEWSALATLLAWFAEQSPVYFQTPENEARLRRMRAIGEELVSVLAQQVDCFAGTGTTISDPVSRTLLDYRDALSALTIEVDAAIQQHREQALAEGADIQLQLGVGQSTTYRPDSLSIGPCDTARVCEMAAPLTSTRALLGLFPEPYLIADQTRMGRVEICYDNMSWQERRQEPVRADDTNVANYYGRLGFELKGRFVRNGRVSELFGFRFRSPEEHHYLFAAMSEEVLDDECPVEWIGQRIVTPLKANRGGIVPNRLTYLSAPRMLPSRLLSQNWDRGAEWRDWFITGIGVERLVLPEPEDIGADLEQHLQALYRSEQAAVYQSLLQPPIRGVTPTLPSLYEQTARLSMLKALIRQQFRLFYPQVLDDSDLLRSAVAGHGGLLDEEILQRFRADSVAVQTLSRTASERLRQTEVAWEAQPAKLRRTGSVASSLAHAMMRLNAVYLRFFASPPMVSDSLSDDG